MAGPTIMTLDKAGKKAHTRRRKTLFSKAYELHRKQPHHCRVAVIVQSGANMEVFISGQDPDWPPSKEQLEVSHQFSTQ